MILCQYSLQICCCKWYSTSRDLTFAYIQAVISYDLADLPVCTLNGFVRIKSFIYRVLQADKFWKRPKTLRNDIFGSQNNHFWSFFKVFSLFQNFIFQLAAPYLYQNLFYHFFNISTLLAKSFSIYIFKSIFRVARIK